MNETDAKRRRIALATENEMMETEADIEIDLLELFFYLLERIKILIGAALLGAAIMAAVSFFVLTPMYEATAKLYVVNNSDSAINLSDLQIGSYLTNDYQEVFKTWEVHEAVLQNLGLDYEYEELQSRLSVSNPSDTRILYVTVKSEDPIEATLMANEYATVAKGFIHETMASEEPSIFSTALEPLDPVSPRKKLNTAIGGMVGMLLAAAILVVRFVMDDKIRTADDISKYIGVPTLAIVPSLDDKHTDD